ncbi:hypothetical protein ACXR2U_11155 [Jatrophihabitans sp. YIM 134969]
MSVHQCPKCELRFTLKPELDWHCREEHPEFRHDYAGPWEHPEDRATRDGAAEARPRG